jgi:nucleoside-diphosphate-sugar epimerase
MKKAIITGSTGLIASGVVQFLLNSKIEVLALGRKVIKDSRISHLSDHPNLTYVQLEMSEIRTLPTLLKDVSWVPGPDCVVYHFAWSGSSRLTDGSIKDQFINVTHSSNVVLVAKELACIKVINAGSQEEAFIDNYLASKWTDQAYHSNTYLYGSAKVAARDMCLLLSYLHKIDYIHTRISVVIEESLATNNYIQSTLKKIVKNEAFEPPSNNQLFDFISKEECARIYYLLGQRGKNKANYFIGTGAPMTLSDYFSGVSAKVSGLKIQKDTKSKNIIGETEDFNSSTLVHDINFKPSPPFFNYK